MSKLKKFFESPRNIILTIAGTIVVVGAMGLSTIYAVNAIAKGNSIDEDAAVSIALSDASLNGESVRMLHKEFDYEDGQYVYEIEFVANGMEYDYVIKSSNGKILKRESEVADIDDIRVEKDTISENNKSQEETVKAENRPQEETTKTENKPQEETTKTENKPQEETTKVENKPQGETTKAEDKPQEVQTSKPNIVQEIEKETTFVEEESDVYIGVDKAKEIALNYVGVSANDVIMKKAKTDHDDGKYVYEIEFIYDRMEYEFEINAVTGEIVEFDRDDD